MSKMAQDRMPSATLKKGMAADQPPKETMRTSVSRALRALMYAHLTVSCGVTAKASGTGQQAGTSKAL
jgi:hypothetical protein